MRFNLQPTAPCKTELEVIVDIHGRGDYCFVELSIRGDRSEISIPEMSDNSFRSAEFDSTYFELFAGNKESTSFVKYIFSLNGGWNCFEYESTDVAPVEVAHSETPDIVVMPAIVIFRHSVMLPWKLLSDRLCGMALTLQYTDGSTSIFALPDVPAPEETHSRDNFIAEFKGESIIIPEDSNSKRLSGIVKTLPQNGNNNACSLPQ